MHLAAAEARILAVSYLLGISADPSIVDRWGNTPLDEALRGGTLYHMCVVFPLNYHRFLDNGRVDE